MIYTTMLLLLKLADFVTTMMVFNLIPDWNKIEANPYSRYLFIHWGILSVIPVLLVVLFASAWVELFGGKPGKVLIGALIVIQAYVVFSNLVVYLHII